MTLAKTLKHCSGISTAEVLTIFSIWVAAQGETSLHCVSLGIVQSASTNALRLWKWLKTFQTARSGIRISSICDSRTTLSMELLPMHRFSMSQRRSSIAYCENSMTASDPAGCSSVRIREDPILSATMESDTAFSSKRQHGVPSFSTQVSPSWNITTGPQTNHESGSPGWRHCGENRKIRSPSPRP